MNLRPDHVRPAFVVALLVAFLVTLAAPTSSASAIGYQQAPIGQVGQVDVGNLITAVGSQPLAFESGFTKVHASPAVNGSQTVMAQLTLQRLEFSGWTDVAWTDVRTGHVSPGQAWSIDPWRASVPRSSVAVYRMTLSVQWFDDATGSALAAAVLVPSSTSEVSCWAAGCSETAAGLVM